MVAQHVVHTDEQSADVRELSTTLAAGRSGERRTSGVRNRADRWCGGSMRDIVEFDAGSQRWLVLRLVGGEDAGRVQDGRRWAGEWSGSVSVGDV